jgi:1-acyl-sn-glycerol-3-phosphate acyltransferase
MHLIAKNLIWFPINLLQILLAVVWTAVGCTICALLFFAPSGETGVYRYARRIWAPGLIGILGGWVVRRGPLPDRSQPAVYVMNHQSYLDIPAAFIAAGIDFRFIAKIELRRVPVFGWTMERMRMVFVDRKNSDRAIQSMKLAAARIRSGIPIMAFPEGTRSVDGSILPFKKGAFVTAIEAGVPIIPMAIWGARTVLPARGFRSRPSLIRLKIGSPIATVGLSSADRSRLAEEVRVWIQRETQALREEFEREASLSQKQRFTSLSVLRTGK